jgi:Na+/H+ antiporter NhaC
MVMNLETKPKVEPKGGSQASSFHFFPMIMVLLFVGIVAVATNFIPDDPAQFGFITLVPAIFLISYIFLTKRILESLTLASLLGFVFVYKGEFFGAFTESLLNILMGDTFAWLVVVCGLMGSIIALIEKAGGAQAFGDWVAKRAKSEKSALMWTWLLGMLIFIDDYLNSLTVGSSMAPVTDRYKVSREKLAYVVDSTAAPVSVLVPISTWAVFIAGLLEVNGLAPEGQGMIYFIKTIPFNFYGWFAALIVPLVIIGIIPNFGPMKKAEERAKTTGVLAPPGSEKIDIKAGDTVEIVKNPSILNFFIPIIFLVVSTIYFEVDMMMGVVATMGFIFIFYIPQKILNAEEYADIAIKGIKNMLFPLVMVVLAFMFADVNDQIGFTTYVISSAETFMSPQMLPFVVFIVLGITEFITGTSWGMYVVALPIVIPLSLSIGADPIIAVAAVISAGVWGSHICFYSDATILSSSASGCDNFQHALTQMPYGFIAAVLASISFLIAGFMF